MTTLGVLTDELTKIFLLGMAAFALAMILTPIYTYFAYKYKFWKQQRSADTSGEKLQVFNKLHADKFRRHIPTMAGLVTIIAITVVTIFFNLDRAQTWLPLAALLLGAIIGFIDDVVNLRSHGRGAAGLRTGVKFTLIAVGGLLLGWWFGTRLGHCSDSMYDTMKLCQEAGLNWLYTIHIPFIGEWSLNWYIIVPIFAFVVVATGNAVNISDGLDGLAGGLLAASFSIFAIIALLQGNYGIAGFCFTILGALLSYLWFNIYPARFFMGDVGSFAMGMSLGVVAMLTNTLFLLPIIGLVFVVEAGSSLLQIVSKKFFHRRIFVSAPVHQHLEATGWPEPKVTMRFWVVGAVCGFIGLILALMGGNI
jgi:phospho-N-acetylmuramoyl-pentapeptide-transferase